VLPTNLRVYAARWIGPSPARFVVSMREARHSSEGWDRINKKNRRKSALRCDNSQRIICSRIFSHKEEPADGSRLSAFEFKCNPSAKRRRVPKLFLETYPRATATLITPKNVREFLVA
jgi:hypothetical protein